MQIQSKDLWACISIALSAFFLLCGYEFIRSPSNTLFKATYGVESLPIVMALMPLGVLLLVYLYGKSLSALGSKKTLLFFSILSATVFTLCYFAILANIHIATAVLYIFGQAYIVLIIEQYWSFLNSTLSNKIAKLAYGPITGIGSVGAILGGQLVGKLAKPLGTESLLLFGALTLVPTLFFLTLAFNKCGEPSAKTKESKSTDSLGISLFKDSTILKVILAIVILTQVISASIGLKFQSVLQLEIPNLDEQTSYHGFFFSAVNTASFVLQFFLVPILLKKLSLRFIHLFIPIVHIFTCLSVVIYPTLETVSLCFLLFKSFDYSLFRVAKELFYIPLSFDARYRTKETIDVFGYRFSKGATSLVVLMLQRAGFVMDSFLAIFALPAAALWFALVIPATKNYKESPN